MVFADFLDAKLALDERSLDPAVNSALRQRLAAMPALSALDVGSGSGASIARMQRWRPSGGWSLTALDRDPGLLERACATARRVLPGSISMGDEVHCHRAGIRVDFVACELAAYRPAHPFDLILAHAFLDLVPLAPALTAFGRWLRPDGLVYATINCDGAPELAPRYEDAAFESALLACYARSMEARRVNGLATGGAQCGRRLLECLPRLGFSVLAAGRSDWRIGASEGVYPDRDDDCLYALIELVCKEGRLSGALDASALRRWHERRVHDVQACRLEMRVPNVDVLACYAGAAPVR